MDQDEILEQINQDREDDGMAPLEPSAAYLKFQELDDQIDEYQNERSQLQDAIYERTSRMREYGFDGDFDPNAGGRKRFDEVTRLIRSIRQDQVNYQKKFSETDLEIQSELESYYHSECEAADYAAAERDLGC